MWLPVSVDDFLPEEAPTLAPLVDLFAWPMVTAEWEGNVSIDTSSGWRIAVSIDARHLTSGAVIETEIDMLGSRRQRSSPSGSRPAPGWTLPCGNSSVN